MSLEELKEKALGLPMEPGVYIMKDSSGTVIYVGKAKMLKNRVSSYFRGAHNEKTTRMISCISTFDVIVANSEFEALVLENQLIKHYRPKYNILLKDDKGYPYIRLDLRKAYPTFSMVNTSTDDGAEYFGPFGGRHATREAIDAVCKALKLPTCGRRFPGDIGKERPCLNYHMGTCLAYCLRDTDSKLYGESISQAVMLLKGKGEELIAQLNHDMEAAAEELRFEYAAELRDRIKAIALLSQKQRVVSAAMADTDVIGFYRNPAKSCFVVLHFVSGQLLAKDFELMDSPLEDDSEAVASLVRQYYEQRKIAPKVIYLPWNVADMDSLSKFLSSVTEKSVAIQVPKRGEKLRLVETAIKNAREETDRYTSREEKTLKTLEWLKRALDLPEIPDRIESFDISNTGASDIVASMVVFYKGRPLKRDYRHFKINGTAGQDDYGSMREAVERRFRRLESGDEKFGKMPNLLLIDGGKVHASVAEEVVRSLGIDVPVFGMVKDDRHRTRALVAPDGREIGISGVPAVFSLIGNIQEETHRFAIKYHRKLRSKNGFVSSLNRITGVGDKRKNELLKHFKSITAIKSASIEELSKVVPKNTARAIYSYFNEENKGAQEQ